MVSSWTPLGSSVGLARLAVTATGYTGLHAWNQIHQKGSMSKIVMGHWFSWLWGQEAKTFGTSWGTSTIRGGFGGNHTVLTTMCSGKCNLRAQTCAAKDPWKNRCMGRPCGSSGPAICFYGQVDKDGTVPIMHCCCMNTPYICSLTNKQPVPPGTGFWPVWCTTLMSRNKYNGMKWRVG